MIESELIAKYLQDPEAKDLIFDHPFPNKDAGLRIERLALIDLLWIEQIKRRIWIKEANKIIAIPDQKAIFLKKISQIKGWWGIRAKDFPITSSLPRDRQDLELPFSPKLAIILLKDRLDIWEFLCSRLLAMAEGHELIRQEQKKS
jgi:hypothetical protein